MFNIYFPLHIKYVDFKYWSYSLIERANMREREREGQSLIIDKKVIH